MNDAVVTFGRYKDIKVQDLVRAAVLENKTVIVRGHVHNHQEVKSYFGWCRVHRKRFSSFHQINTLLLEQ